MAFGGYIGPAYSALTESWNGTSWTSVNSLNTARGVLGGAGTQTATVAFGGSTPTYTGATELWNGTSWTTNSNSMSTARGAMGSAGTQAAALGFGGGTGPSGSTATEAWTGQALQTKTITVS